MGERSVPPIRKTCKRVAPFAELTTGASFAGNVPVISSWNRCRRPTLLEVGLATTDPFGPVRTRSVDTGKVERSREEVISAVLRDAMTAHETRVTM